MYKRILTDKYKTLPKGTIIEVMETIKDDLWLCRIYSDHREFYAYIEEIVPISDALSGGL